MERIPPKNKILVVDDEPDVVELIRPGLINVGYTVVYAKNGPQALEEVSLDQPDLVLLDLKMPGMSGMEVCKALKANGRTVEIPLVILSGMKTEADRILALEIGVDDYVTKPFSPRELVLRIQAVLRRSRENAQAIAVKQIGELALDSDLYTVRYKGKLLYLTLTEFKLLERLIDRPGHLQSREVLLQNVWSKNPPVATRTVDTHIQRLRDKLGRAGHLIKTIRGKGYQITASME